jgi:hypothetical protein
MLRAVSPRERGLAPWSPQKATLLLLDQIRAVLAEYAAHLPLTIRQIFYRLVGAYGFDKTELAYKRLGEHLNRARRARLIDFDHIRDDSADIRTSTGWNSTADLVLQWAHDADDFRLDRQDGQPGRLLFVVEAAGMRPQIQAAVGDFSIPVIASGGFDSLTAKHALAQALGNNDGPTEVLHIGDLDTSGTHVFLSQAEDVQALMADLGLPGTADFTRLAVLPEHIKALDLPTAPPKPTDRRAFAGDVTVQAEAIPPDVMADIVTQAVTQRIDQRVLKRVLAREARCQKWLLRQLGHIDLRGAP